jgi:hypothetical protein
MSEHRWIEDDADLSDGRALEDLLDGTGGDDGAKSFRSLGLLVAAARRPSSDTEVAGEAEAMALYRRLRSRPLAPRDDRRRRGRGLRLIAIAGAVTVASATGAAAATGGLPEPVQDTAATLLGNVGISVPVGGGVPPGPPVPAPAATTTTPDEAARAISVAETTVEADVTPPISIDVTVAASTAASQAPAPPPAEAGSSDDGDAAKPGKGGLGPPDDVAPAPHDNSGQAKGQEADHAPPGQGDKGGERGAGATKPMPPKVTAGPTARP